MLDTDFPLPTVSVNWGSGWLGALPPYAAELATLRAESCAAIYEHQAACQAHIGFDSGQTLSRMQRVLAYAEKLCTVCSDRRSKSGVTAKLQQQHHRRSFPLEFEWCFPAEPDSMGHAIAECIHSALPGFEYLCLLSCVCISMTHAAELSRECGDPASAIALYKACIQIVNQKVKSVVGTALNAAQWNCLHRQGLPMQLLPSWLAVLAAKANHKAQLCAVVLVVNDTADSQLLIGLTTL